MSDDRLRIHIGAWIKQLELPSAIELRHGAEIIDSVQADENSPFEDLAEDLLSAATADSLDEGKSRTYQLVGINEKQERWFCPLRIRRRIDRTAGDMVATLAKQVSDLHELLRKERKQGQDLLMKYAEVVSEQNNKLVEENNTHRTRSSEVIDKLENLRSKSLERDMAMEKHKADIDIKERITDAAVPLMLAIGNKWTGGVLPARDLRSTMLLEVFKSLEEEQLGTIKSILGNSWPTFEKIVEDTFNGKAVVEEFRVFAAGLPQEQVMALVQVMNVGQQAAIQELLHANGN